MNYAYARSSGIRQEMSCPVQADAMRSYAATFQETIDEVFSDAAVSGFETEFFTRPEARRLMAVLQPGDHVYVHKIDRMGRQTVDILQVIEWFRRRRVSLHIVDFGGHALDLETPAGFVMIAIQAVFAEFEAKRIGERVRHAISYRARMGLPTINVTPPGMQRLYRRDPVPSVKVQITYGWHSRECDIVRELHRRVIPPGRGFQPIAEDFCRRQLRSPPNGRKEGFLWSYDRGRGPEPRWTDGRLRKAYRWYCCLLEFGLDIESYPANDVAAIMHPWSSVQPKPRSLAEWAQQEPQSFQAACVALTQRGYSLGSREALSSASSL